MKHPTWFSRWKAYPMSCLMHVLFWGAVPGALLAYDFRTWPVALVMLFGFAYYEAGSGYRKAVNDGKTDTVGLDFVDAVVGFVPAYLIVMLLTIKEVL